MAPEIDDTNEQLDVEVVEEASSGEGEGVAVAGEVEPVIAVSAEAAAGRTGHVDPAADR